MTELTIGTDWGSYLAWNEQIQLKLQRRLKKEL